MLVLKYFLGIKMNRFILSLIAVSACLLLSNTAYAYNIKIESCNTQECEYWFSEYKRKSREGYADAMEVLGTFYHVGYGTSLDKELALRWYKRSSKYFSISGAYKTGLFYLNETSFVNIDKGISYLKKAARKGHPEASYLLGVIYSQDDLIPQDYAEADKWLSKAFVTPHKKAKLYTNYLNSKELLNSNNFPELSVLARQSQFFIEDNNATEIASQIPLAALDAKQANSEGGNNMNNESTQVAQTQYPDNEMEVIEVTSVTLVDLFESDIAFFKTFMAEKRDGQARKGVYRRTCADSVSCSEMSKEDFSRMLATQK